MPYKAALDLVRAPWSGSVIRPTDPAGLAAGSTGPCSAPPGVLHFDHVFYRTDCVTRLAGLGVFLGQRLGLLARPFVNAFVRHRLDEEVGECPDQSVDAIRRIACAGAIEISGQPALL